jgi:NitT/TauT family transport system ATP-binding protein
MTRSLELQGVSKGYGIGRSRKVVVSDCSFAIEKDAFTVMIGPSGAGKSTLVRLIAGFERPDAGRITLDGAGVSGPGKDRLVMFQETALFPWMTTRDNVSYGPRLLGKGRAEGATVNGRVNELLARFGLAAFDEKYPIQLSGGMQRRAELARALLNEPAVMILDEPFRGLDALTKELMLEYYRGVFEATPRTNLFVNTDIDEAIFLADRLLVMTHIPTRLLATIEVDLPRPRSLVGVSSDDRANVIKEQALALLRDEGMKAFRGRVDARPRSAGI